MNKLNSGYFYWKRNNWMIDPRILFYINRNIAIDRPIFILGNQGDGLTLLSRMLRRNKSVISATGNNRYWSGASEVQNVYEMILPPQLSGLRLKAFAHNRLYPPRSWSYACNELIDKYRKTEKDANESDREKLKTVLKICTGKHGQKTESPRFVDKSQVYTIKMAYIATLLRDYRPYFIYLTRNPYAAIYRAATGKAVDFKNYSSFMSLDERISLGIEHWLNSARCIETDKCKVEIFLHLRFEDLLASPAEVLKNLCEFVDLDYSKDMLPQPHHKLPLGTKYEERWYPLRVDVNESYLSSIPEKYIEWIHGACGDLAKQYGYERPDL